MANHQLPPLEPANCLSQRAASDTQTVCNPSLTDPGAWRELPPEDRAFKLGHEFVDERLRHSCFAQGTPTFLSMGRPGRPIFTIRVLGHFPVDSTVYYPLGFPDCQV